MHKCLTCTNSKICTKCDGSMYINKVSLINECVQVCPANTKATSEKTCVGES